LGIIALNKTGANPYNMNMKNTKAILLIILGSFLVATGFAYAGEALDQLKAMQNDTAPVLALQASQLPVKTGTTKDVNLTASGGAIAPAIYTPTPPPAAKPAPTMMETAKKWIGDNFSSIVSALVIGLIAFMVLGTGGAALAVGAAAFGAFYMMGKL